MMEVLFKILLCPAIGFFCVCFENHCVVVNNVLCSWSGISEEKTLNPVQLAGMKAERIAREKAAAAQNAAVRKQIFLTWTL